MSNCNPPGTSVVDMGDDAGTDLATGIVCTADDTGVEPDQSASAGPLNGADRSTRRGIRSPLVWLCLVLTPTLIILLLSLLSTRQAHVAFVLRVSGATATLSIDGQSLTVPWPRETSQVSEVYQDPNYRLFQVDGSTMSGSAFSYDALSFTSVAGTLYYRFQCWLRDCSTYSAWGDFTIHDDSNARLLLNEGKVDTLPSLTLPSAFTLSGTFERPERASSLRFSGSTIIQLTIDQDGREVRLGDKSIYYPRDWQPYLALAGWTITRSYLLGVGLLLLLLAGCTVLVASAAFAASRLAPRLVGFHLRGPAHWIRRHLSLQSVRLVVGWGATAAILAALLGISDLAYFRLPRTSDEVAYYVQAVILRSGHFTVSAPSLHLAPFFPGSLTISDGRWFAAYPPGAPLAYAFGMLVDAPWIVNPIFGAAGAFMIARLALRWYGGTAGLVSFALVGFSPFFLFLASSYLSHMACLFYLLLFLSGMDLLEATGAARWGFLASIGIGFAFLTREYSAVLFALPVGAAYGSRLVRRFRRRGQAWPVRDMFVMVIALTSPALLCYAFYVFYNWQLSGVFQILGRATIGAIGSSGIGTGVGATAWTPASGLVVVDDLYSALLIHLFGWPYYLTLSFFFLPLATLRLRSHDLLLYGIAIVPLAGYAFYYANGIAFGPRYIFESLPAYIILTARGILIAGELAQAWAGRVSRLLHTTRTGGPAAFLALAVLMSCDFSFYLPLQFPLYTAYLGHGLVGSSLRQDLAGLHNALVISDSASAYHILLFPLNDPFLRGDVVYANSGDWSAIAPLLASYPRRAVYALDFANDQVVVEPISQEVLYQAALHAQQSGDFASDLAVLRRLLAVNADYKNALFAEGWAMWNLGQQEAAITAYRQFVEHHAGNAQAQLNLGYSLIAVGRCPEALAPLRAVLHLDPANAAAKQDLEVCGDKDKT